MLATSQRGLSGSAKEAASHTGSTPVTRLDIIAEGKGDYLKVDPDGYREWVRDHKSRAMVPRLMSEKEAVEKLVADGDYLVYECNYLPPGPSALLREVIRQKKKELWVGAKF